MVSRVCCDVPRCAICRCYFTGRLVGVCAVTFVCVRCLWISQGVAYLCGVFCVSYHVRYDDVPFETGEPVCRPDEESKL